MSDPTKLTWLEASDPEREPFQTSGPPHSRFGSEREFLTNQYPSNRPNWCPGGVDFGRTTDRKTFRRGCSAPVDGNYGLCATCHRFEEEQRQRMRDAREQPEDGGPRKSGRWAR